MTTVLARVTHGLEWVLADEVSARLPDARRLRLARREVRLRVGGPAVADDVLRTADDVLVDAGGTAAPRGATWTAAAAADALAGLAWDGAVEAVAAVRPLPAHPLVDVVAVVEGVRRLTRFAVEHALGPVLARRTGGRYLRRTAGGREPGEPDLTFRVVVRDDAVAGALRLGRAPAHRRPWKLDTGPGTLHPPVAAALVRLARPAPGEHLLDPFCGDGTIPVEAALATSGPGTVGGGVVVHGRDLDDERLRAARANADRAGVAVDLRTADAARPEGRYDVVVTNPPWNLAVDGLGGLRGGLDPFWRAVPGLLSGRGRLVALADAGLEVPALLAADGFDVPLATRVRLAGRLADVVVATPPARPAFPLGPGLAGWRRRALDAGVVTEHGF